MEIWIGSMPGTVGGAATECAHAISLLRDHDVDVHVVPFGKVSVDVYNWCFQRNVKIHDYQSDIFADKIVAHWCDLPLMTRFPEIMVAGKPRCLIHFPCMTSLSPLHLAAHRAGWIDRWGWVSEYQRGMLEPQLSATGKEPAAFEGYRPFYDPSLYIQGVLADWYDPPTRSFCIGRVSRDDPDKFSQDTWEIYRRIDVGKRVKFVTILGFGPNTQARLGLPRGSMVSRNSGLSGGHMISTDDSIYELHRPGSITLLAFLRELHCILHKTGGSRESFGRFAIEAMFAGVPVIVERAFAFPEFITHGETGFLCESSDEMVETASMLARDEKRRKQVIDAARDDVKRICRPETCWRPWESLLKIL